MRRAYLLPVPGSRPHAFGPPRLTMWALALVVAAPSAGECERRLAAAEARAAVAESRAAAAEAHVVELAVRQRPGSRGDFWGQPALGTPRRLRK